MADDIPNRLLDEHPDAPAPEDILRRLKDDLLDTLASQAAEDAADDEAGEALDEAALGLAAAEGLGDLAEQSEEGFEDEAFESESEE